MRVPYKIYAVHNPFDRGDRVTYLSGVIRTGTNSHWNHIAIEFELNGVPCILESVGKGVILQSKYNWSLKSNREVLVLSPIDGSTIDTEDALDLIGEKYGYLDLAYIIKYVVERRWNPDTEWDGECKWEGWFCSELAAHLIGLEKAWLVLPCDFVHMDFLVKEYVFYTKKGIGVTGTKTAIGVHA